jgi:hypothetical protein
VVSGLLDVVWCHAHLVAVLRTSITYTVRESKVLLHHVEEHVVAFLRHAGVAEADQAVVVQGVGDFLTLGGVAGWVAVLVEEGVKLNHRQLQHWVGLFLFGFNGDGGFLATLALALHTFALFAALAAARLALGLRGTQQIVASRNDGQGNSRTYGEVDGSSTRTLSGRHR